MWWLILLGIYFVGACIANFATHGQEAKMWRKRNAKKISNVFFYTGIALVGIAAFAVISYILGFIWYYFCGGFLLFADIGMSFLGKIALGAMTLFFLAFLISGVIYIFKR